MTQKLIQIITLILLFKMLFASNKNCLIRQAKIKQIIRGHDKNILHLNNGALITSRKTNGFLGANSGNCLRDTFYTLSTYTWSSIGYSIIFQSLQQYELNTLKIRFWDGDNRFYRIQIYSIFNSQETLIYDDLAQSVFEITFPDQFVQGFKVLNVAGNTYNAFLHILKIEAYYKQQMHKLK